MNVFRLIEDSKNIFVMVIYIFYQSLNDYTGNHFQIFKFRIIYLNEGIYFFYGLNQRIRFKYIMVINNFLDYFAC